MKITIKMKPIKTDATGVTLELGKHIPESQFDADGNRSFHVGFIPIAQASKALVDVANRRILWLGGNSRMCWDERCCGGKIKAAIEAYEQFYGVRLKPGSDAPGTDMTGLVLCGMTVRGDIVTSHLHTTQKHNYAWDWQTMRQVTTDAGWKYQETKQIKI